MKTNDVNMEKMITKIQNLFDLAENNPNENEAIAAALKAQELMAKYNIEMDQIKEETSEEMFEAIYENTDKHEMKNWKLGLASIVARNFCCKTYTVVRKYDGKNVVFYGHKKDAKIALSTFKFLYESGNKLAVKYYYKEKKAGRNTKGIMNDYLIGFRQGIADVLDKQCTALMLVTPPDVEEAYAELSKNFSTHATTMKIAGSIEARKAGKADGKDIATARGIE